MTVILTNRDKSIRDAGKAGYHYSRNLSRFHIRINRWQMYSSLNIINGSFPSNFLCNVFLADIQHIHLPKTFRYIYTYIFRQHEQNLSFLRFWFSHGSKTLFFVQSINQGELTPNHILFVFSFYPQKNARNTEKRVNLCRLVNYEYGANFVRIFI